MEITEEHPWLSERLEYHMNSPPLCLRLVGPHTKTIKKQTNQKKFDLWLTKQVVRHLEESVHHGTKEEHALLPCGFTAGEAGLWYLRGQLGVQKTEGKVKKRKERMVWELVYDEAGNTHHSLQKRLFQAIQKHIPSLTWEKFALKFRENWFRKSLFQQKLSLRKRLEAFFKHLKLPVFESIEEITHSYFEPVVPT